MFWVGTELGYIEKLSILSFLRHGHRVRFHCYDHVRGVPEGVEIADAAAVVDYATVLKLRHRQTRSFALASDYFRFRLQQLGSGIWVDSDVVCLQPLRPTAPILLGWESDDYVNGAVLYIEQGHPLLDDALASFAPGNIPHWLPWQKSLPFAVRKLLRRPFGPADLPRGTFGPKAITALVREHGLVDLVMQRPVLYPLHPRLARQLFAPGGSIESWVTEESLTIHLWNEKLRDLKQTRPPADSALGRLLGLYGI